MCVCSCCGGLQKWKKITMKGKIDSKNELTVVIEAYTGDKGSSQVSSTTKSESSFKMVTCKLFCLEESRECGT